MIVVPLYRFDLYFALHVYNISGLLWLKSWKNWSRLCQKLSGKESNQSNCQGALAWWGKPSKVARHLSNSWSDTKSSSANDWQHINHVSWGIPLPLIYVGGLTEFRLLNDWQLKSMCLQTKCCAHLSIIDYDAIQPAFLVKRSSNLEHLHRNTWKILTRKAVSFTNLKNIFDG